MAAGQICLHDNDSPLILGMTAFHGRHNEYETRIVRSVGVRTAQKFQCVAVSPFRDAAATAVSLLLISSPFSRPTHYPHPARAKPKLQGWARLYSHLFPFPCCEVTSARSATFGPCDHFASCGTKGRSSQLEDCNRGRRGGQAPPSTAPVPRQQNKLGAG
jgi:hypothetical protein